MKFAVASLTSRCLFFALNFSFAVIASPLRHGYESFASPVREKKLAPAPGLPFVIATSPLTVNVRSFNAPELGSVPKSTNTTRSAPAANTGGTDAPEAASLSSPNLTRPCTTPSISHETFVAFSPVIPGCDVIVTVAFPESNVSAPRTTRQFETSAKIVKTDFASPAPFAPPHVSLVAVTLNVVGGGTSLLSPVSTALGATSRSTDSVIVPVI